jgi:hypothetical protein
MLLFFVYNESCPFTMRQKTGIHPGGIKTLQREGRNFAGYLMWQRSQGIGLTIKEL